LGWDDTLVISNVTGGGTSASTIYDDETVYVDYGCKNSGDADAGHFRYGLYIDGVLKKYVDKTSLAAGWASYIEDSNVLMLDNYRLEIIRSRLYVITTMKYRSQMKIIMSTLVFFILHREL
jgi:subtilase family serine protease